MARKRRSFTPGFKAEAVRLCRLGDRSIPQIAHELDLPTSNLRLWLRQAEGAGAGASAAAVTSGRTIGELEQENLRLQQKVKRLEMDREILKKAAAFFAKESV